MDTLREPHYEDNSKKCPICGIGHIFFTEKRYSLKENKVYDISVCNHCLTAITDKEVGDDEYRNTDVKMYLADEETIKNAITGIHSLFKYFMPYIGTIQLKNVLDFGAGPGYMAICAAEEGASEIYALDLNVKYIENTLRNYPNSPKIHIIKRLEEIKAKMDIVFLWHILEHVEDPCSLLENIKLYCSENAIFFIQTPQYDDNYIERVHIYLFNSHSLKILLERAGFNVIHIEYDHTNKFITTIAKIRN